MEENFPMLRSPAPDPPLDCAQQAQQLLMQGVYDRAAQLYEQVIQENPDHKPAYWSLGLALLLQQQETEAQMVWLTGMADGTPEQVAVWTEELITLLKTEAERRERIGEPAISWAIRQHIRELAPDDVPNLLALVELSLLLERFTGDDLTDWGLLPLLESGQGRGVEIEYLLHVLRQLLESAPTDAGTVAFAAACVPYVTDRLVFLAVILPAAVRIGYALRRPDVSINLCELYLQLDPNNLEVMGQLAPFYQNLRCYEEGIEMARRRYQLTDFLPEKIFSSSLVLRGLMSAGGYWQQSLEAFGEHEILLQTLIDQDPTGLLPVHTLRLFTSTFFLPYFRNDLSHNRSLQNEIARICQQNVQLYAAEQAQRYAQPRPRRSATRPLRIGYLSHCLGTHSVGWLARWLIQHHDRERFQLYGYFISYRPDDAMQDWYVRQMDQVCKVGTDCGEDGPAIAERIYQDDLDLLIDLDSITLDITCEVMALKPAPVQATWLGWDASGIPTIDYYIVDPYVVPEEADAAYREKLWRLPQTYIAVDGFEVGIPNLRRDDLGIPADAVVFLSAQKGYKRHRDTAQLQMRIIKEVPNSYFLIKGFASQDSIQEFFREIAREEGVELDRLRFLPDTPSEPVHRANLAIADVVLDTFPYNGATTTLETLWMGIPLVTRVGQHFSSRNSYTMLMNTGVTTGIARSAEEYVEWGVRLGTDAALRQQTAWQLRQARQTAPLWNGRQFTQAMEQAYIAMIERAGR